MKKNHLPFWRFHRSIAVINREIRPLIDNPPIHFDLDSVVWREQTRQNLNLLLSYLGKHGKGLDVGCGKGHIAALFQELGYTMTGIDIPLTIGEPMGITSYFWEKPIWRYFSKKFGAHYQLGNATKIPFAKNSFDFVIAYAVIEHITPPRDIPKFLKEIHRVLKPGGYLLLADTPRPQSYTEKLARALGLGSHPVTLSAQFVATKLQRADFEITYQNVYDLLPAHPPGRIGQLIVNAVSPLMFIVEQLLRVTPLKRVAHHSRTIARKGND